MAATPNWQALQVQIPGQDLLEGARQAMESLMVYLEIVKTILETVKIFLIDVGNPIKPIVEAVLNIAQALFEALKMSGIYAWYDLPDPRVDPNFNKFIGGFPAFLNRYKAGLLDSRDPNRPQPIASVTSGGFIIIVADGESQISLVRQIQVLTKLFGIEFLTPRYQAPSSPKVLPLGRAGDPILAVARMFQEQPTSVVLEWSLPKMNNDGDPGFTGLIPAFSTAFKPPKYLIEKSEVNPVVGQLDVEAINDTDAVGPVWMDIPTVFKDRNTTEYLMHRVQLSDAYGDPFIRFQKYIVVDVATETTTFLLGQLGTFRYIDDDVEVGKTYYYRVRAFSGSLNVTGDNIQFPIPEYNVIDGIPHIVWPSNDKNDEAVVGWSSGVMPIRLPEYPANFDVIENLKRLFQVAFSLNFHLPLTPTYHFNPDGSPVAPATVEDIGKGSLTNVAGSLSNFKAIPIVGDAVSGFTAVTEAFQPDPATGKTPELPWNNPSVRRNAARLATTIASNMLQANSANDFKYVMETFPSGTPSLPGLTATNLSELVFQVTSVQDPNLAGGGAVQAAGVLYSKVFDDQVTRLNVLQGVNRIMSFTLVGAPPDWVQVSFLRDIVPWSGQLVYDLLAKMYALLDAYSGAVVELKAFIDSLVAKINVLENFLRYLTSLLDFVLNLSLGFYVLNVPAVDGGVRDWIQLIENAGGTPPPSGPGGYTGGISFAYVAANVVPLAKAFAMVF